MNTPGDPHGEQQGAQQGEQQSEQRRERPGRALLRAFGPFLLALLLLLLLGTPAESARRFWPQAQILAALRQVESGNREDVADGDGGAAIGPYQIHYVYWLDATAADQTLGGGYQDCRRRGYSTRVVTAYMRRYVPDAWRRGEAETIARVHNGGPRGHRIRATLGYWQRVRQQLPP
jgi:hypothetical protein